MKNDACEINPSNLIEFTQKTDVLIRALEFTNFIGAPSREVKVATGTAFITGLLKVPETAMGPGIAVTDNYGAPNTKFPHHQHNACESFVIYQGEMQLHIEGQEPLTLTPNGKPYWFSARKRHWAFFPVETRYIAITVPAEESWPSGK